MRGVRVERFVSDMLSNECVGELLLSNRLFLGNLRNLRLRKMRHNRRASLRLKSLYHKRFLSFNYKLCQQCASEVCNFLNFKILFI